MKSKRNILFYIFIFFLVFFFHLSTYNYETLDWDINAFLVTSLELGRGNLPYENQYENKPPLLFVIFYLFSWISGKNLVLIKLLNDLIIGAIALQTVFLTTNKGQSPKFFNFLPSIYFILFTSNVWFHPSYSEYLALFFLTSAYLIYRKFPDNFFLMGVFIGLSTLINLGTSIFLISFIVLIAVFKTRIIYSNFKLLSGFSTVHLITLMIYALSGNFNNYIMAMFSIPVSYGGTIFSLSESLTVFLVDFAEYDFYIYLFLISTISIFLFSLFKLIQKKHLNVLNFEIVVFIFSGLLFFQLAGKGYYHHLIFLLYFLSLTFFLLKNAVLTRSLMFTTIILLLFTISNFLGSSIKNVENFNKLNNNYPMKVISEQIALDYEFDGQIFSNNNILILYYLDQPNASYIVHPALYDYEEITSVLIEYKKIRKDEVFYQVSRQLDLYEGIYFEDFDSAFFNKFSTGNKEFPLLNFWSTSNFINIFIKN